MFHRERHILSGKGNGFLHALHQKGNVRINFVANIYDEVAPYIVTDYSVETLTGMINQYVDYSIREVIAPVGESVVVGGYYEFYADEEALDALLDEAFYRPK